ncbi:MAG: aspartate/glutamate racemase family protein [Paracoccus sp. (in: a-proteobacteria)]|jgi:hypothetical protein|uniref:aspartate/glutamate racemase family protein n=1 Tax=Paracoccus sp. TaxID=267 RepID=UPI003002841F
MSDPIRPFGAPGTHLATGGKAIYGAPLGILMLEARFPRVYGEMGNALTWPFPVMYRIVRGATPDRVVCDAARGLLDDFIAAARDLVDLGAEGITTNCGFLSIFQKELVEAVRVPVATSAMMQVPWIDAALPPGRRAGIVTINAPGLTIAHLEGIGVPADTPIRGTENGTEFFRTIIRAEKQDLDLALACADVVAAAQDLVARHPEVGAIVLECTNMSPYSTAVRAATGLPVYDIYSLVTWFHAGLRPRDFSTAPKAPA